MLGNMTVELHWSAVGEHQSQCGTLGPCVQGRKGAAAGYHGSDDVTGPDCP